MLTRALLGLLLAAPLVGSCQDDGSPIVPVRPPRDAGCVIDEAARTFEVYFVIDVSNSMVPFLDDLASELLTLTEGFPETNARGDRILASYFVVAFVNDVQLFPEGAERMTSHIAVASAIRAAIAAAEGNTNLRNDTENFDDEENLIDALGAVVDRAPRPDNLLVLIATDAEFEEAPETLSGGITVTHGYRQVQEGLRELGAQVQAFVPSALSGLTRPYRGFPPLTALEGGRVFDLERLTAARENIRASLEQIALDATCRPAGPDAGPS